MRLAVPARLDRGLPDAPAVGGVDVPADRRPAVAAAGAGRQAAGGEPGAGDWPGCIGYGSPAAFAGRDAFLSAVLAGGGPAAGGPARRGPPPAAGGRPR